MSRLHGVAQARATATLRRVMRRPLRRIVATRVRPGDQRVIEELECGHEQPQKRDLYGETNAIRRRCRQCPPPGEVRP